VSISVPCKQPHRMTIYYKSQKSIDGCLKYFFRIFFLCMLTWKTYLLCIFQHRFDWTIPAEKYLKYKSEFIRSSFRVLTRWRSGVVKHNTNLCWKIHNKYVFHVNIHIFVLKYLVQIQIIQNQFKISEGGKWNSHQMPWSKRTYKLSYKMWQEIF
jgi:hypothetical protein